MSKDYTDLEWLTNNVAEFVKQAYDKGYKQGQKDAKDLMDADKLKEQVNAIQIPNNASNGDVIKAMFPDAKFDNAMPFTDGRWETMNLDTENKIRAMYKPTQLRTYADWWNAPYKAEIEEI